MVVKAVKFAGGVIVGSLSTALIVLSLISIVGLIHLTKFTFNAKMVNGQYCVELNETQMKLVKLTVILQWIILGIMILQVITGSSILSQQKKTLKLSGFGSGYGLVLFLGMLAISAFYYYGLSLLTKLAFKATHHGGVVCLNMGKYDFVICQIVVVLMWVGLLRLVLTNVHDKTEKLKELENSGFFDPMKLPHMMM